jgi:lipopolysaccharide transport system permease protein
MVELRGYARGGVGDAVCVTDRQGGDADEGNGDVVARAQELIAYRSLVRNLVTKDLKVRYKSSVLGFVWSLLNPLLMMLVYTTVFKTLLATPIENFEVFILVALLPWNWCSRSLASCATSLIDNSTIINKVYFPRVLLPVSVVASEAINFLLALPALFLMMLYFRIPFTPWIAYLPVLFVIQAILLAGLGFLLAALNVVFRDTGVILEVLLLAWFFLTPIFYDIKQLVSPDAVAWMYRLNPMASIITQYRTILYDQGKPDFLFDIRAGVTCLAILVVGYLFFTSLNRRLGEHL